MAAVPACDAHVHVFDPARHPYSPSRKFTPGTADVAQLASYLDQAGMARVVLVQPSVYGVDNRCMVEAIARLGDRARGVAVVSPKTPLDELHALADSGVVGARLNMVVQRRGSAADAFQSVMALDALLPQAWHVQLHVSLGVLSEMADVLRHTRRTFVLDHLGLPAVLDGVTSPQWTGLLKLLDTGRLYVKLSGPYLSSAQPSPYEDLAPFVDSLITANPERIVWGSNWPHTQGVHRPESTDLSQIEQFRQEDPLAWPQACARWAGQELFRQIHRNAQSLYGFAG